MPPRQPNNFRKTVGASCGSGRGNGAARSVAPQAHVSLTPRVHIPGVGILSLSTGSLAREGPCTSLQLPAEGQGDSNALGRPAGVDTLPRSGRLEAPLLKMARKGSSEEAMEAATSD